jgi:hypothetical protein
MPFCKLRPGPLLNVGHSVCPATGLGRPELTQGRGVGGRGSGRRLVSAPAGAAAAQGPGDQIDRSPGAVTRGSPRAAHPGPQQCFAQLAGSRVCGRRARRGDSPGPLRPPRHPSSRDGEPGRCEREFPHRLSTIAWARPGPMWVTGCRPVTASDVPACQAPGTARYPAGSSGEAPCCDRIRFAREHRPGELA